MITIYSDIAEYFKLQESDISLNLVVDRCLMVFVFPDGMALWQEMALYQIGA